MKFNIGVSKNNNLLGVIRGVSSFGCGGGDLDPSLDKF